MKYSFISGFDCICVSCFVVCCYWSCCYFIVVVLVMFCPFYFWFEFRKMIACCNTTNWQFKIILLVLFFFPLEFRIYCVISVQFNLFTSSPPSPPPSLLRHSCVYWLNLGHVMKTLFSYKVHQPFSKYFFFF